jgi:fucose permease
VLGIGLTVGAYITNGITSVYFLSAMGFGAALLWGTIWGLALRQLGKYTKLASALLLMSVVGGGIFPLIFGRLIDINTAYPQTAVLMLIPCYLFLLIFSTWGYKVESCKVFTFKRIRTVQ